LVAVALANEADAAGLFVGASAYPHACAVLDATWPVTTTRAVLDALAPDAILTNHFDDPLVKIATALGLPWTTIADLPAANQRHDREPADGGSSAFLARIIHEKCAIKAKPLISLTTMRMGCLMKFFAMKFLAQVFGGLGRFRAVR